jgi:hypothetical protein
MLERGNEQAGRSGDRAAHPAWGSAWSGALRASGAVSANVQSKEIEGRCLTPATGANDPASIAAAGGVFGAARSLARVVLVTLTPFGRAERRGQRPLPVRRVRGLCRTGGLGWQRGRWTGLNALGCSRDGSLFGEWQRLPLRGGHSGFRGIARRRGRERCARTRRRESLHQRLPRGRDAVPRNVRLAVRSGLRMRGALVPGVRLGPRGSRLRRPGVHRRGVRARVGRL